MQAHIPFRRIGCEEAETLIALADTIVLDVRDKASFSRSHIDGAVNISTRNILDVVETTQKNHRVLIYCHHGVASREYAKFFCDFGFMDVYSLDGGYDAWSVHVQSKATAPQDGDLVKWLVEHGFANGVDAPGVARLTPLMKASNEGDAAIVKKLVAAGASLNATNADGNNALWLACAGDRLDIIDLLVSAGIDVNNRNDNGATALIYAASAGKDAVVIRLLNSGADRTLETLDGFSALDLASTLECLTLLRNKPRVAAKPALPVHEAANGLLTANLTEP
jgi:rhodanese-related sulfurtransferase